MYEYVFIYVYICAYLFILHLVLQCHSIFQLWPRSIHTHTYIRIHSLLLRYVPTLAHSLAHSHTHKSTTTPYGLKHKKKKKTYTPQPHLNIYNIAWKIDTHRIFRQRELFFFSKRNYKIIDKKNNYRTPQFHKYKKQEYPPTTSFIYLFMISFL